MKDESMPPSPPASAQSGEPEVYAVSIEDGRPKLDRRDFIEITGAAAAAVAVSGCAPYKPAKPGDAAGRNGKHPSPSDQKPPPTSPSFPAGAKLTKPPAQDGKPGTPKPGKPRKGYAAPGTTGTNYTVNGIHYTMPCGSPTPPGAVCTCNCVSVPASTPYNYTVCSCNKVCTCDTVCSCVGHVSTSSSHYWYPN